MALNSIKAAKNSWTNFARAEGAEAADVARRVLEDYLDFRSLPKDDLADWAEASVQLTPEIMSDESLCSAQPR